MEDPPFRFEGISVVFRPHERVGFDVTRDFVHFAFVADDVFVIIALPYRNPFSIMGGSESLQAQVICQQLSYQVQSNCQQTRPYRFHPK